MKTERFNRLYTAEGEALLAAKCSIWTEYPRPQMKRDSFFSLNGTWEFICGDICSDITVPYPPESLLSGIGKRLGKNPSMIYRRKFKLPDGFHHGRVILHFGAVDQVAEVYLNGIGLGGHRGGYEAFSFDITDCLGTEKENLLEVHVTDELENHILPYGKQREKRGGMWYTPISGIWQTVWLESVCEKHIDDIRIETGADFAEIKVIGVSDGDITVITPEGDILAQLADGAARIEIKNPRMWSPEDPYLYEFTIVSGDDRIESYFALRTLDIRVVDGISRLCLNGKPYYFHGVLDQGYYSDGIFTPASPESYKNDILAMKSLGFNTLRKHIKIEPEIFYCLCDRLGMVVFQDMVNNGPYSFIRDTALPTAGVKSLPDRFMHRDKKTRDAFINGMESTVRALYNHPCICYWTIFNEGWGQFDSQTMYEKLKSLDPGRFVDTASGWFRCADSDVESPHIYFKPVRLKKSAKPIVLSEFGGYSYKPKENSFNPDKTYGYRFFEKREDFENALIQLYEDEIIPAVKIGLCGDILTQLSDVEDETNGLLSYDRRIVKVDGKKMIAIAEKLKI